MGQVVRVAPVLDGRTPLSRTRRRPRVPDLAPRRGEKTGAHPPLDRADLLAVLCLEARPSSTLPVYAGGPSNQISAAGTHPLVLARPAAFSSVTSYRQWLRQVF